MYHNHQVISSVFFIIYLKNLFQIVSIAISIAFIDFCHFFIEYSVYFIFTGTSTNLIFLVAIISIISEE
ncbi:MAG: hypothetical protein LBC61_04520 [Candidatus Peribacteria bacterium]|nr:hypothetical protein [Candidatus Peribacteria bacterium]